MISRSLLLVLLVLLGLACLQSFTAAQNSNGPVTCCVRFVKFKIPLKAIEKYTDTRRDCAKRGIIFTTKNKSLRWCADPGLDWVQNLIQRIDKRQIGA